MEKSSRKKIIFFLIALAVLAVLVVANLKKSGHKTTVMSDVVERGTITAFVSGPARIQPEEQVKISAKVSGQIMKLGVKEGDYVQKGQFLVQLDPVAYQAAVNQSESNLNHSKAGYEKAKSEYARSQTLFKDNLISRAELEIAKAGYQQAKAQVEQSTAALEQAKDNLSKTTIYSPMQGTVSKLNKKEGEMAMGSQFQLDEIMRISDLTRMTAEVEIDENDIVSVTGNDSAKVEVDAFPDSIFYGIVTDIASSGTTKGQGTQNEVTNFQVKVAMLDLPLGLRPGMSATVDIMTDTRINTLKLPIQCVTVREPVVADSAAVPDEEEEIRVVFVIREGKAYQTPVKLGISSETDYEIVKGVSEGDEVVSGSYKVLSEQLSDGDEVSVDNSTSEEK